METSSAPQTPPGWRAQWSPEHNVWYFVDINTQASQWEFPAIKAQPQTPYPTAPIYGFGPEASSTMAVQAPDAPTGPDGDRGLGLGGKIAAGGAIGIAGGLLAGAIFNHEKDEVKKKKGKILGFFNHDNSSSESDSGKGGRPMAWFSKLGGGGDSGVTGVGGIGGGGGNMNFTAPLAMGAAGAGLFGKMASHVPHMPNHHPQHGGMGGGQAYQAPYQAPATAAMGTHVPAPPQFHQKGSPPLHIICAAYADRDVTALVRRLVKPDQSLQLDTKGHNLVQFFGDPWPDHFKQFSVLYTYGQRPWEVKIGGDDWGMFEILPHTPLDKTQMEYVMGPQSGGSGRMIQGRIVALVWGKGDGLLEGRGKGRAAKLKEIEETGEFEVSNSWMGFDGWGGPAKTAIVYYRAPNGEIKIATGREGGTCRMPWNPLAMWS